MHLIPQSNLNSAPTTSEGRKAINAKRPSEELDNRKQAKRERMIRAMTSPWNKSN